MMVMKMMAMMKIMSSSSLSAAAAIQLSWCTAVFVLCYSCCGIGMCVLFAVHYFLQSGCPHQKKVCTDLTQLPIRVRYCVPWAPRFHLTYLKISASEYLFLGWKKNLFINMKYVLRCSILLNHHIYKQCAVCINIGISSVDFYIWKRSICHRGIS